MLRLSVSSIRGAHRTGGRFDVAALRETAQYGLIAGEFGPIEGGQLRPRCPSPIASDLHQPISGMRKSGWGLAHHPVLPLINWASFGARRLLSSEGVLL